MDGKPQATSRNQAEQHMMEMEAILDRIAGLLRILTEEIVVFDYFNEKYRLWDPDVDMN